MNPSPDLRPAYRQGWGAGREGAATAGEKKILGANRCSGGMRTDMFFKSPPYRAFPSGARSTDPRRPATPLGPLPRPAGRGSQELPAPTTWRWGWCHQACRTRDPPLRWAAAWWRAPSTICKVLTRLTVRYTVRPLGVHGYALLHLSFALQCAISVVLACY